MPPNLFMKMDDTSRYAIERLPLARRAAETQGTGTRMDTHGEGGGAEHRFECDSSPVPDSSSDYIFLEDLRLSATVGLSAFSFRNQSFPLSISIKVNTRRASKSLDVISRKEEETPRDKNVKESKDVVQEEEDEEEEEDTYSVSYGDVCRSITTLVAPPRTYSNLEALATAILSAPFVEGNIRTLTIVKYAGLLRADREVLRVQTSSEEDWTQRTTGTQKPALKWTWALEGARVPCVIGIYDHERAVKQDVVVSVSVPISHPDTYNDTDTYTTTDGTASDANRETSSSPDPTPDPRMDADRDATARKAYALDYSRRILWTEICNAIDASHFKTVEALASHICRITLGASLQDQVQGQVQQTEGQQGRQEGHGLRYLADRVTVSVSKPSALVHAALSGAVVTRTRNG